MSDAKVEIVEMTKRFGAVDAVADVTIKVEGGEVCGLLGGNGAGKTTLLKATVGIVHPSSGSIRIGGVDTRSPDVYRTFRAAGYLPQTPVLYGHLTGREHLRFVAALYGVGGEAFRQVEKLTDEMEMGASIDRPIRSYSLGMKRRLGLLAAIVHSPDYLFLDEPTASLDDEAILALEGMIQRCRDRGGLILIATHRMESLGGMFDRVAVLKKGRLDFEGSPQAFRISAGNRQLKKGDLVERGVEV